jgi:hypothetical protein
MLPMLAQTSRAGNLKLRLFFAREQSALKAMRPAL